MNATQMAEALFEEAGVEAIPQPPDDDGTEYIAITVEEAERILPILMGDELLNSKKLDWLHRWARACSPTATQFAGPWPDETGKEIVIGDHANTR